MHYVLELSVRVCVRAMCMLAETFFDRHAVGYCSVQFNVK